MTLCHYGLNRALSPLGTFSPVPKHSEGIDTLSKDRGVCGGSSQLPRWISDSTGRLLGEEDPSGGHLPCQSKPTHYPPRQIAEISVPAQIRDADLAVPSNSPVGQHKKLLGLGE